jgi:hypothetical protein
MDIKLFVFILLQKILRKNFSNQNTSNKIVIFFRIMDRFSQQNSTIFSMLIINFFSGKADLRSFLF